MHVHKIEIPAFLEHLQVWNGMPVPFTVKWFDGVPDFRVIDPELKSRCVVEKLCAICGHKLGEWCWFIGGINSERLHLFIDPAMHEKCAEFAARVCPHLNGRVPKYSTRPVSAPVHVYELASERSSSDLLMLKTRTKKMELVRLKNDDDSIYILANGPWFGKRVIREQKVTGSVVSESQEKNEENL